jgi:uncharacterized coiled-coil protein SlyX
LPLMAGFRRALFGYRRGDVDQVLGGRDARIAELESELATLGGELSSISSIVVEREREIRALHEQFRAANERHDQSIRSLEAVSMRLEELHAQARGQATRIRMKALGEAVEVSRRVQALAGRIGGEPAPSIGGDANGADHEIGAAAGNGAASNGKGPQREPAELFEGLVRVEIGPLGDFSQLLGFEDAAGKIAATSQISVERFSEGRATLAMRLDEPVELLRELEERSPLEFRVKDTRADRVILDLDADGGESAEAA